MKYFLMFFAILAMSGCDSPDVIEDGLSTHPANSDAKQTPPAPQSDTLKVTYSRKDPLVIAPASPKSAPMKMDEHGSPGNQSKPAAPKSEPNQPAPSPNKEPGHEGHGR